MVTREHLLHDCPSDVRFYFSSKYIADENASPKEQAINLRQYAEISKLHHAEVIEVLNALPATCLASTRNALPALATFAKGEKKKKVASIKLQKNCSELIATYKPMFQRRIYTIRKKSPTFRKDCVRSRSEIYWQAIM
jgi:hypothetical protein